MTGIQWTDETWNPVTGCTKVSTGCKHCYAEKLAPRVFAGQLTLVGRHGGPTSAVMRPRRFTDVMVHDDRLDRPLHWRKPRRVFVNSMSDLFHEDVPDEFIAQVFAVMMLARKHTFQVLTKRPDRMRRFVAACPGIAEAFHRLDHWRVPWEWPIPNVWLGVSCENQETADERIPILLDTPAAVRFVSAEPLLGPVELSRYMVWIDDACSMLDWIIAGGESGPKARPCDVGWIRSIVEECRCAGVPVFVKQRGSLWFDTDRREGMRRACTVPADSAWTWVTQRDRKGGDPSEWPEDLRVREWPEVSHA